MEEAANGEGSSSTPPKEIEIDEADAPYLDLKEDWELKRYMMIMDRPFINTRCYDPSFLMMEELDIGSEEEETLTDHHQPTYAEKIAQGIEELKRRVDFMERMLHHCVELMEKWERFMYQCLEQMQEQTSKEMNGYFRWMGFNPGDYVNK